MRKNVTRALFAALAIFVATPAFADGPGTAGPDVAAPPVRAQPVQPATPPAAQPAAAPAEGRSGVIPLNGDELTINVPNGYRLYSAEEAYAFLQRNNATAPSGTVLGLLAPANTDVRANNVWATVISYDAIGYVQAETASGLSDTNLETQTRDARAAQNKPFEGFAVMPAFVAEGTPQVVWAERTAAPGGGQGKDFRHELKLLGRYGVATMTSIGSADQMPAIEAAASEMQNMLSFPTGRTHADFQAASDQVSAYSIPGLVTGVAAESGTAEAAGDGGGQAQTAFGGLAGYFPWIALGVVVLAGVGYMMMRRRDDDDEDDEEEAAA
ncbi:DUF2167 domain-containing protein [Vitreimonas flagellata]|uniref:DUF2167 domain-containing protein n=1 Tax=Vitreimonas flagellata TaxID=2560861 RepID=UPI0010755F5A|nr:DUF2167 domain-containing protein [Vitreimonas flagellata]